MDINKVDEKINELAYKLAKKHGVQPTLDCKILIQRILNKID